MYFSRHLLDSLRSKDSQGRARLILGARQTGKSTLLGSLRGPDALFIDLQDRSERMRFSQDPAALARIVSAGGDGPMHVLIDEIQRVPELLDEVQLLADRWPGRFTFTLTGSSARKLRREANMLPGRARLYRLFPVMLEEQAKGAAGRVLPLRASRARMAGPFPARALEDMLVMGSLPGIWGRTGREDLEAYAALYIEEEVEREALTRKLGPFGRFLRLAAVESGRAVNLTKISQETGIALSTLKGFYSVLEDTMAGFSLGAYSGSSRVRLLKTPKFFFFDVGVRNALAGLPLERGILATEGGQLFEHWVACELFWRVSYLGRGHELFTWRTVAGSEVDFVVRTPRGVVPVEAKYTAHPRPEDAAAIERFIAKHPEAREGFLVCRIPRPERLTPNVTALPWSHL